MIKMQTGSLAICRKPVVSVTTHKCVYRCESAHNQPPPSQAVMMVMMMVMMCQYYCHNCFLHFVTAKL